MRRGIRGAGPRGRAAADGVGRDHGTGRRQIEGRVAVAETGDAIGGRRRVRAHAPPSGADVGVVRRTDGDGVGDARRRADPRGRAAVAAADEDGAAAASQRSDRRGEGHGERGHVVAVRVEQRIREEAHVHHPHLGVMLDEPIEAGDHLRRGGEAVVRIEDLHRNEIDAGRHAVRRHHAARGDDAGHVLAVPKSSRARAAPALLGGAVGAAARAVGIRAEALLVDDAPSEVGMRDVDAAVEHGHRHAAAGVAELAHLRRVDERHALGERAAAGDVFIDAQNVGIVPQLGQAIGIDLSGKGWDVAPPGDHSH